ncbi:hypothetical protein VCR4J2_250749 [Vibrio coralliirubri]|nr:hypothetical protein VCR4J2_250749 [Vibrio coralliirubri]
MCSHQEVVGPLKSRITDNLQISKLEPYSRTGLHTEQVRLSTCFGYMYA